MKAQMSKMAIVGLCLLLLMSTINSLSQGEQLFRRVQQWNELQPLWQQLEQAPKLIEQQQRQLAVISQQATLGREGPDIRDPLALVQYLEAHCKGRNLRLLRLPEASQIEQEGFQLNQTQFSLEGSLADILGLVYQIEQKDRLGQLTQLQLEVQEKRLAGQKQSYLLVHITLQNLLPV